MIFIKNCNSKPSISYFSKLILFTLLATSCLPIAHSNIIRYTLNIEFYFGLTKFLIAKYPEEPKLIRCILDFFETFEIEKKFVDLKSLASFQETNDDIMNYVNLAEVVCRIDAFFMTPIGLVCAVLLLIAVVACVFQYCSCKYDFFKFLKILILKFL